MFGPNSTSFGERRPGVVQLWNEDDQLRPDLVRNCRRSARVRPNLARNWSNMSAFGQTWPHHRSNVARCRPEPTSPEGGPEFTKLGPSSTNLGPNSVKLGPDSTFVTGVGMRPRWFLRAARIEPMPKSSDCLDEGQADENGDKSQLAARSGRVSAGRVGHGHSALGEEALVHHAGELAGADSFLGQGSPGPEVDQGGPEFAQIWLGLGHTRPHLATFRPNRPKLSGRTLVELCQHRPKAPGARPTLRPIPGQIGRVIRWDVQDFARTRPHWGAMSPKLGLGDFGHVSGWGRAERQPAECSEEREEVEARLRKRGMYIACVQGRLCAGTGRQPPR